MVNSLDQFYKEKSLFSSTCLKFCTLNLFLKTQYIIYILTLITKKCKWVISEFILYSVIINRSYQASLMAGQRETLSVHIVNSIRLLLLASCALQFVLTSVQCHCINGMCEKKSLSLNTDTRHNSSLTGYVFESLNASIWKECFNMCVLKCQCHSFNFNEINKTENCQLNDATATLEPEALKEKKGVTYYQIERSYLDQKVSGIFFLHFSSLLWSFPVSKDWERLWELSKKRILIAKLWSMIMNYDGSKHVQLWVAHNSSLKKFTCSE